MNTLKAPLVVVARLLLALMFITSGYGKLAHIDGAAGYIASAGLPAASLLALGAGLLELVAGIALIIGFKARWAALAYVQQLMFMKNLAVAGGMFLVAALGAGPLSIDARRVAA